MTLVLLTDIATPAVQLGHLLLLHPVLQPAELLWSATQSQAKPAATSWHQASLSILQLKQSQSRHHQQQR
jgi:hypothetical protein